MSIIPQSMYLIDQYYRRDNLKRLPYDGVHDE